MRVFLFFMAAAFLLSLTGIYTPAFSQRHNSYCDRTKSTAEAMDCINRHKTDVQNRLNKTYKELSDTQKDAMKGLLNAAQQAWVAYRDAQCAWESGDTEAPALDRVYEISCIAALTEARADMLSALSHREEENGGAPREFSSNPRWMNVLSHDYPDVFWRYGEWLRADLDCDGDNEQVMPGIAVKPAAQGDDSGVMTAEIVLAVSENPVTGRPKTTIFRIPVGEQSAAPSVCGTAIDVTVTGLSSRENKDNGGQGCATGVQISDKRCPAILLSWNGDQYELSRAMPQPDKKPSLPQEKASHR